MCFDIKLTNVLIRIINRDEAFLMKRNQIVDTVHLIQWEVWIYPVCPWRIIEAFSKERNDEYVGRAEEYKAAKSALLEGLGLEHLFDHSHELTPKEKEIWMLFDRVDVAELLARDAFAKGAYMLGAEDREIMLK